MYNWFLVIIFILIIVYLVYKLLIIDEGFQDVSGTDVSGTDVSGIDLSIANASVNTLPISSIITNIGSQEDSYNANATVALNDMSNNSSIFDSGSQSFVVKNIDISKLNFNDDSINKAHSILTSLVDPSTIDRRSITDVSRHIDTFNSYKEHYTNVQDQYRLRGDWSQLRATRQIITAIDNHIHNNLT